MKNSKTCPKCRSIDIIRSTSSIWKGNNNYIQAGISSIPVTRYVCVQCGFSEEWIESKEHLLKLKDKWKKNQQPRL